MSASKIDIPDLDLRAMLCDMHKQGAETAEMIIHKQGTNIPIAAVVLVIGPNTSEYVQAFRRELDRLESIECWPH